MWEAESRITDAELEIMRALWASEEPMTLAQLKAALAERHGWSGDTTKTLLRRLCEKGAVGQEKRKVYCYRPLVARDQLGRYHTQKLIDKLYAGSAKAMVAALLAAALICGVLEWKRNWFYRMFCPLTAAGAMAWAALGRWEFSETALGIPGLLLYPLTGIMTAAALVTALAEAIRREITSRTEARLLAQRGALAQSSYEALRRQHEQVMMLRHDMVKHLRVLRQTVTDEKAAAYLDDLIGENEKIRPVVQSGNEMLDVILNSKLSAAADAGIAVELAHTQAPDKLPLTDAELCSLMLNLLDNAVEAASAAGVKRRYIKLDMHIRNHFFVFVCENGATLDWINKETAPERGLGLKVIRQIVERYGNLSNTEYGDDYYKVKVLIPLRQPLK